MNGLRESSFVVSHVPRAYFPKQLNQFQGISVLFRPVAQSNVKVDLRVVICGTRLLYEQDSTSFIDQMVNLASMHPSLLQTLHYQAKSHIQKVEEFLRKAETHKQIEVGKQRLGPSSLEWLNSIAPFFYVEHVFLPYQLTNFLPIRLNFDEQIYE